MVYSFRNTTTGNIRQVLSLISTSMSAEYGLAHPFNPEREYPLVFDDSNLHNTICLWHEEGEAPQSSVRPASSLSILERSYASPLGSIPLAMIGSVVTDPADRKKGLSRRCFESAFDQLEKKGIELAVLWSHHATHYARLGFYQVGTQWLVQVSPSPEVADTENLTTIIEGSRQPELLAQALHGAWSLYQQRSSRLNRSLEEMRLQLSIPNTYFIVVGALASPKAYLVFQRGSDFPDTICEWGGDPIAVKTGLGALRKQKRAKALLLMGDGTTPSLLEMLGDWVGESRQTTMCHVRALNPDRLISRLQTVTGVSGLRESLSRANYPVEKLLFGPWSVTSKTFQSTEGANHEWKQLETFIPIDFFIWGLDSI